MQRSAVPSTQTTSPTPATDPRTQRRKARGWIWLAIAVAVGWLLIGGGVGQLSGKLSEVQSNDNASSLPASAESTLVSEEQKGFTEVRSFPVLIVVSRPDGAALTADDKQAAQDFVSTLPGLKVAGTNKTLQDFSDGTPLVPIPSQDGRAVLISYSISTDRIAERLDNGTAVLGVLVDTIRTAATKYPDLQINVTGPGGFFADLIKVFGAIDIQLLGATLLVVIIILIVVYRSPVLWVLPIFSALMANVMAGGVVYLLAKSDIIVLNGQSQGILTVLVIGAATDYALLMIARYREELHHYASHLQALRVAWRGVVEPIVASGATVSIGLLCLLLSELNSNRSLGPVGAVGIVACMLVLLTLLPALLAIPVTSIPLVAILAPIIVWVALEVFGLEPSFGPFAAVGGALGLIATIACIVIGIMRAVRPDSGPFAVTRIQPGRWVFWPRVPDFDQAVEEKPGAWGRVASAVGRRPRATWIVTGLVLLILAGFTGTLKASGISFSQSFANPSTTDSVIGQGVLADHFAGGLGTPTIIMANAASQSAVIAAAEDTPESRRWRPTPERRLVRPDRLPQSRWSSTIACS